MARIAMAIGAYALALLPIAVPRVTGVAPAQVPLGQQTRVEVTVQGATPDTRVALSPGGPYLSGSVPLADAAWVFAMPGSDRVLAFSAHEVVLLNGRSDPPEQVGRAVIDATIRHAASVGATALMADDRNALYAVQTIESTQIQITPLAVMDHAVADIALGDGAGFALLVDGAVMRADLVKTPMEWTRIGTVDGGAAGIAFDGLHCYLHGTDGELRIAACASGELRELARFRTSGRIHDLHVAGGIAYVADGPAGLTLLDVRNATRPRLLGSHNKLGDTRRVAVDRDRALVSNTRNDLALIDVARPELPLLVSKLRAEQLPQSIALRDDIAWSALSGVLARHDFSAEPASLLSDEGASLGGSRRGFIRNNTLFVADWFSGLHLYDVSDRDAIRHVGNYHSPGSSKGVVVRDRHAFVADDDHGVHILDISNPERPVAVKNVPTPGLAYTMKLVDDRLYVADHRGGIHIIDVSNVPNARVIGSFDTPGKAWAIDVRDGIAFVADDSSGLLILDTTDPKRIHQIGQFAPGGLAEDVRVRDRHAFVTFFDQGLYVVDIQDPRAPREVSHLDIPGNARGIDLQGQYGYVAAWEAGLQVVDLRDPRRPTIVGYHDTDGSAWGVNVSGPDAYVLDWWGGVKRIDIRDPARPVPVTQYQARADIVAVALRNCCAATVGAAGVQIYDVMNGLNPIWINGVDVAAGATSIAWPDDTAYVATADGIVVIDMRDPFAARQLRTVPTPWRVTTLRAAGQKIVALGDGGFAAAVDPVTGELRTLSSGVKDAWMADNTVYLARGGLGLTAYTLGGVPVTTKTVWLKPIASARLLRMTDNTAVVVDGDQTLRILGRRENSFSEKSRLEIDAVIRDVAFSDQRAYVTTARNELVAIDVRDLAHPTIIHRYTAAQTLTQFALGNEFLFFAGERKPGSLKLLPNVEFERQGTSSYAATLPGSLPQGAYDVTVRDGGRSFPGLHNAVRVSIKTGKKPEISSERFRELLEQQRGK